MAPTSRRIGGCSHTQFSKERITIYELVDPDPAGGFPAAARPMFGFDFTALELYDIPGVISEAEPAKREPFRRAVKVPVRPHLGVMGVAPQGGRVSSIPPGVFGGNVDNWRFGPGATVHYPVFHEGAGFLRRGPTFRPRRWRDLRHSNRGFAERHAPFVVGQ